MKKLIPIIIVAFLTNLIVTLIYNYSNNVPYEQAVYLDNIMSGIWILGIVAGVVLIIINRKSLFKKPIIIFEAIIAFVFCTPLPWVCTIKIMNPLPDTVLMNSTYNYTPGKVHKTEHWEYSSGDQTYIDKKFVTDSAQFDKASKADLSDSTNLGHAEDAVFKKDSIWVYFNKDGVVIKTEKYSNGKLLSSKK